MMRLLLFACALIPCLLPTAWAQGNPISAVVTVVEQASGVSVRSGTDRDYRGFVGEVEPLRPGDCVRARRGGVALIRYRDGARVRVRGGHHCLQATPPEPTLGQRARAAAAGAFGALISIFQTPEGGPRNMIAKGPDGLETDAPSAVWVLPDTGEWRTTDRRPTLLWLHPSGVSRNRVEVRYRTGTVVNGECRAGRRMLASGTFSGGRAAFPSASSALQEGRAYAVELVERDRVVDVGCIYVASSAQRRSLLSQWQEVRTALGDDPSRDVFLAAQMKQDGYLVDALTLLDQNGSGLALQTLDEVLSHVGPFTPAP